MTIKRKSLLLLVGSGVLGVATLAYAAKGGIPGPPDGGGMSDTSGCQINFSVALSNPDYGVRSDGGPYPDPLDNKDKSGARTGSGPGLRFDTNGTIKLERANDTRTVVVNAVSTASAPEGTGADFRFHLNSGGLDLCALGSGETGNVAATLRYFDYTGSEMWLLYDCITQHGDAISGGSGSPLSVTRSSGDIDTWARGDEWVITGGQACLQDAANYAGSTQTLVEWAVDAPFTMTITAQ